MSTRPTRQLSPRCLFWLLWLALLLPAAQVAAAAHALSHVAAAVDDARGDSHALHSLHCDLCITATSVAGAAPLAMLPGWLPDPAVAQAAPRSAVGGLPCTPAPRLYESRAPPFAQA
jgi:hypothetical protein